MIFKYINYIFFIKSYYESYCLFIVINKLHQIGFCAPYLVSDSRSKTGCGFPGSSMAAFSATAEITPEDDAEAFPRTARTNYKITCSFCNSKFTI